MNIQEFLEIFPEFDCLPEARVSMVLEESICTINEASFGASYNSAIAHKAAHELKVMQNASSGQVASEKVGDLSRSYNLGSDSDSFYRQTQYGLKYIALRESAFGSPMVLDGVGC